MGQYRCIRPNLPKVKELSKKLGYSPATTAIKIEDWQDANNKGTSAIPTIFDMGMVTLPWKQNLELYKSFKLLTNQGERKLFIKETATKFANSLNEKDYDYAAEPINIGGVNKNIWSISLAKKLWTKKDGDSNQLPLFNSVQGDTASNQAVTKILDTFKQRFKIDYEIISPEQAQEVLKDTKEKYTNETGFYFNNKVYIVDYGNGLDWDSAIHEYGHPFMRALSKYNPNLFTSIVQQITNTPEGKELLREIVLAGYPENQIDEELAVRALTKLAKKNINPETGSLFEKAVDKLLKFLTSMMRDVFGKKDLKLSTLSPNTTIEELADIFSLKQGFIETKSIEVKPGVQELFDSNPELANQVYETLGFDKLYKEGRNLNTSYLYAVSKNLKLNSSKGSFNNSKVSGTVFHISKNKIEKFSNENIGKNTKAPDTILGHFFSESYFSIASMRETKDDLLLINGQSILGHEIHEVSINLQNPYVLNSFISSLPSYLGIDSKLPENEQFKQAKNKLLKEGYDGIVYGLDFDGQDVNYGFVVFDSNNIKVESIKNDKLEIEKARPLDFNKTTKINYNLTPQQKQQALEAYSQYLDTIFPDSKVKDIVYHGSKQGVTNTPVNRKNIGKYFSNSKDAAMWFGSSRFIPENKQNEEEPWLFEESNNDANIQTSIINLINPAKEIDVFNQKQEYPYNDGVIANEGDYKTYITFNSEQIHILSSKADIQGFKDYMAFQNSEFAKYGTYEQFRQFITNKSSMEIENRLIETGKIDRVC